MTVWSVTDGHAYCSGRKAWVGGGAVPFSRKFCVPRTPPIAGLWHQSRNGIGRRKDTSLSLKHRV